jgi:hypothetical protein
MKIFSLYVDFYTFLDKIAASSKRWEVYLSSYYQLHQEFLESYFAKFPLLDSLSLKQRVEAVKPSDYSWLRHLVSTCPPEELIAEAHDKCTDYLPAKEEPDVYLFVGFFSPDGFVMNIRKKPVICFGLERFKDFRLLRVLFAHEYVHYLLYPKSEEISEDEAMNWFLISEGLATHFSSLVFPDFTQSDHLLLRRDVLNWCQVNERLLRETYLSEKYTSSELFDLYKKGDSDLGIPPRAGKFLGYTAVQRSLESNDNKFLRLLLSDKNAILSLDL